MERLLRAYHSAVKADRAAAGRPQRWLKIEHDDDGSVLVRGWFPAEEGALIVAALDAAQDQLATLDGRASEPGRDVSAETSAATGDADVSAETSPAAGEARGDALVAVADSFLAGGLRSRAGGDRHQVLVHLDVATLSGGDESGRCELGGGTALAPETARRLACDASIVRLLERDGRPLTIGRKTRSIPPALRRALQSRDRGCRFPGCGSRRFVDAHHIEHWAHGGATDLDNLVQLCSTHHRLLHEGGFSVERRAEGGLTFRRPDGCRIPDCPGAAPGRPAPLQRARRPDACVPLSHDRLDLELAVEAVLTFAPPGTGEPPGI